MPRIDRTLLLDEARVARISTPRDDIVGEQVASGDDSHGPLMFVQADGPFEHYERRVELADGAGHSDGQQAVRETLDFQLPRWTWRFVTHRACARTLRRPSEPGRMPWWAPSQRPDARAAQVLGLLATLSLVLGYLGTLVGRTMTYVADEFDVSNATQSDVLSVARVGAGLAILLTALADRRGRRRLLRISLVAGIGATVLGAFTPNLAGLAASQAVNRGAWAAGVILLGIIASEEMPAGGRAYAVGLLAMTMSLGSGMALWVLPLADTGERSWRILYVLPLVMLPLVLHHSRRLPETRRYVRPHRNIRIRGRFGRLWLLASAMFLLNIFNGPIPQFQNEFLRDERGFSGGAVALFVMATSTPGGIGIVLGGRLAETVGRRAVAVVAVLGGTALVGASFALSGPGMWISAAIGTIVGAAVVPSISVYWAELFPTSLRGQANGIVSMTAMVGSVVGLQLMGRLSDEWGSFAPTMPVLAVGPLLMAILVLTAFPETAHQELEDINPEDRSDPTGARDPTQDARKDTTSSR